MNDPAPPMPPEEDWPALTAYLAHHGMTLTGPSPHRFPGGLANRNYLIHLDGQPTVLRRPPPGPLPPGAHDMAREHRILSRLPDALPAAPRSLHLCEDPAILGAPFQLLEYRPGRVIRAVLPNDLPPTLAPHAPRLAETMLTTLADIHAIDPAAIGLDTLGRPELYLERQRIGWHRRGTTIAETPETRQSIDSLAAWLEAHPAPHTDPTLLHGDFKLDNLILHPETLIPTAVVDWDQGTRGDPLFDLATLLSYWTEPNDPAEMHALHQMPTAEPGFPTREQAAHRYAQLTGRHITDFRHLRVLALLKLAVIFLQLGALARTGATADPRYGTFTAVGTGILTFAHGVTQGRTF